MWQPKLTWADAKRRAQVLQDIRYFFNERSVVEVDTPNLCHATVTDVHLDAFSCLSFPAENDDLLYLQTSPEFSMKRLLAAGYQSIYQIGKAFRYESSGRFHNPEFTMLEWYRVGFDHFQLMTELDELLQCVLGCQSADKLSYQQVFIDFLAIDPLACNVASLKDKLSEFQIFGDWIKNETDKDILLQVLFSECIEPELAKERPCFIYHYPASQSALARLSNADSRVAERFECYFKGIELANGFNELTDPNEQLKRFEIDNIKRAELNKLQVAIDHRFIQALQYGLPDCAGVAVGIDRLLMLALDKNSISEVMSFNINNA